MSALNACKTKRPLRVTGILTSQVSERCCLYISSMAFYIRKIEGAVVGPYWRNHGVYENVKYVDEKHVSLFT